MKLIGIFGLGYVGLPLAIALASKHKVLGFDINKKRIKNLKLGIDETKTVSEDEIKNVQIQFHENPNSLKDCNIYIITVPTPLKGKYLPDFSFLEDASLKVSKILNKGDIVIYESTVYPGATEDICIPILEKSSLVFNKDFYIGYSPERINIGDSVNTFKKISKIVSASNKSTLDIVENLYQSVIDVEVYKAPSIKIAEAAKVVENTQRDVNIAFVNEIAMMFSKFGIDTSEVLKAASTKWNFNRYNPGLVGGHCIGVDPYYLVHRSISYGFNPIIISNARKLNETMPDYICEVLKSKAKELDLNLKSSSVLIMGASFKENVKDIRNSKSIDLYKKLNMIFKNVDIYDPIVKVEKNQKGITILSEIKQQKRFDIVILSVAHDVFSKINPIKLLNKKGFVYDIKSFYNKHPRIYRL